PAPVRGQQRLPPDPGAGGPDLLRAFPGRPPGGVRRAAAQRASVLRRDSGPSRVPVPPDAAASAVRRAGGGRARTITGGARGRPGDCRDRVSGDVPTGPGERQGAAAPGRGAGEDRRGGRGGGGGGGGAGT